ncbi:TOMM precursor leader peptide-binding protein [Streptomyces erythrochromogenes]|uniref:TOMM precursor leader peptide-binding protein n=1 Tax=Streptomyces erythrochromogenes TaxID=285574 RepID=UPI00224E7B51|nr:TOMM precursor leader peptide-binding protein [Streptomyces erythrochromogenes]MCX5583370.1 TOMM precursor leader peptide-binding protein [Streptomyces erythrochromogenes]
MTTTPPRPLAPDGTPLEAARRHLAEALEPLGAVVVTLGVHDALGPRAADPFAAVRPRATVHLTAREVLVGPWGGDGSAPACGQCLAMRRQRLRSRSERDALETGRRPGTPTGPEWPRLSRYAHDAVYALHGAVHGGGVTAPAGAAADRALPQVSRLDLETLRIRTYPLLADPLCPDCGPRGTDVPRPFAPASRPKPDPGAQRLRAASSYPMPYAALANPVTGVLGGGTWLNVTSPTTAPVAGSVFMRGYAGLTDVTWSGQANSFAASRDLAHLEGLERYAGTHRRTGNTLLTASYAELGERALDPAECGFYAPETYRDDPLVSPFDPERPIPWVYGHSLRDDRPVLVPARLVHYSAGVAADNFVFECSNGCAIGSCPEEALLGALLELVERDAFLLAWYGGLPLTEIDLASVPGTAVRTMADRAALQGYDVHAFDNRVDLAVPVVTGLAVRRDGGPGLFSFGAGAALDPAAAVEAALSEVLTYIPHLPRQVEERRDELEAMAADFGKVLHLKDHAQLYGLPAMAEHVRPYREPVAVRPVEEVYRSWTDRGRPRTGDLRDDLLCVVDELVRAGHDVIVVDQTTPEQRRIGLHTVCAVVPGLLPIDFGWARQRAPYLPRLRTAPRRAGLRTADLADADVRRVPHPFP